MDNDYSIRSRGKIYVKDGKYKFLTNISGGDNLIEIDAEEIFEDFEEKTVEIEISPIGWGRPRFNKSAWETMHMKNIRPDYKHCSEKGKKRFSRLKIGMFVHWGIYSQLGVAESWPANAEYCDKDFLDIYYTLWQVFNPTDFSAEEWADLCKKAGLQFIVFTSKHHDGFCMYNTSTKTWARMRTGKGFTGGIGGVKDVYIHFSIMETPFGRDIMGEIINAFRKKELGVGIYYSHIDWNDPNFRWDPANRSYDPDYGPDTHPEDWNAFIEREKEQIREILSNYGPIDMVFFDGTWYGMEWDKIGEIMVMARTLQPDCMFSNRGIGPYGDFTSPERWIPKSPDDPRTYGMMWQVCDPIHNSWAYIPGDTYKPLSVLLKNMMSALSKGGTYLFAVSPMPNGRFPPKTVDILEKMGKWLKRFGKAVYDTVPYPPYGNGDSVFYTCSEDGKYLYISIFDEPGKPVKAVGIKPDKIAEAVIPDLSGESQHVDFVIEENTAVFKADPETVTSDEYGGCPGYVIEVRLKER